jgi:uncharacterized protein YbcV (DUF1398 family)
VNSRDIISLNIDHKAKVVAEKKQQVLLSNNLKMAKKTDKALIKGKVNESQKNKVDFQQFASGDDELMFLINKFDLENLTEDQL